MPDKLRELLRAPQWLKTFLGLPPANQGDLLTTWHDLLQKVWQRDVVDPPGALYNCETALQLLAKKMARSEELWVPRALLQSRGPALNHLVSRGVLVLDERGHRVGFAHQLLYEFARARTFLGEESLVEYVRQRQDSLFVRPTLWTALGYLRVADRSEYTAALGALWGCTLRRHVWLLLVEFLGQQEDPDDHEASLLLPLLQDTTWQQASFSAVAGSRGWFERLKQGYLKGPMTGKSPGLVLRVLSAAVRIVPDEVLTLVRANWASQERFALCILEVLRHLEVWNEEAFTLADGAVIAAEKEAASVQKHYDVDGLVFKIKEKNPEYAIRLITCSLKRKLERVLQEIPKSQPPVPNVTEKERTKLKINREPRSSLDKLLSSVSSRYHCLCELAESAPKTTLDNLLPWLSKLLTSVVEPNIHCDSYLDDLLFDSKPDDKHPREFAYALRIATEKLSEQEPLRFFELIDEWKSSNLMSIHVVLFCGLLVLAKKESTKLTPIVDYLLGDHRRLLIGDFQGICRYTVTLLEQLGPKLSMLQISKIENAIKCLNQVSTGAILSAKERRKLKKLNRYYRFMLFSALPNSMLSTETRTLIAQEQRAFGISQTTSSQQSETRWIGSPMGTNEMAKARDEDVVKLFDGLVDETGFHHPQRPSEGGSVQASREFGSFAKLNPQRAITISKQFKQEKQEIPASLMLKSLAEIDLPTEELENLVVDFDRRGFASGNFRTHAAWALNKRASELSDATVDMLASWLVSTAQDTKGEVQEERGNPPFLWGLRGGGLLPGGNYPILSTITESFLSRTPPNTEKWLDLLENHLERNDSFKIWLPLCLDLEELCLADVTRAATFLENLMMKYSEVLNSAYGVRLLAKASWWLPHDQLNRLVLLLRGQEWSHAKRAFGELIGFLGVREPIIAWAKIELNSLVDSEDIADDSARVGVAGICLNLWTSSWREACTNVLERLAKQGSRAVRTEIMEGLRKSEIIVDEESRRLLVALACDPEAFFTDRSSFALNWVSGLVHCYPKEVQTLVERIVNALETKGSSVLYFNVGLGKLVDLSITMQRIPAQRQFGLDIFERLLHIGFYGAREALDEADKWPRHRRNY